MKIDLEKRHKKLKARYKRWLDNGQISAESFEAIVGLSRSLCKAGQDASLAFCQKLIKAEQELVDQFGSREGMEPVFNGVDEAIEIGQVFSSPNYFRPDTGNKNKPALVYCASLVDKAGEALGLVKVGKTNPMMDPNELRIAEEGDYPFTILEGLAVRLRKFERRNLRSRGLVPRLEVVVCVHDSAALEQDVHRYLARSDHFSGKSDESNEIFLGCYQEVLRRLDLETNRASGRTVFWIATRKGIRIPKGLRSFTRHKLSDFRSASGLPLFFE